MMKGKGWWRILKRQMFFKATQRERQGQESTEETDLQSCQNCSVSALQPRHLFYLLTCSRAQTPFNWVLHKGGEGIPFTRTPIPLPLSAGKGSSIEWSRGLFSTTLQALTLPGFRKAAFRLYGSLMLTQGAEENYCQFPRSSQVQQTFWRWTRKMNKDYLDFFFVTHSSFFKASRKSFWNARGRIRMAIKGGSHLQHYTLGTIHPC